MSDAVTREIRPMVFYHVYCETREWRSSHPNSTVSCTVEVPQIRSQADYERMLANLRKHWKVKDQEELVLRSLTVLYVHPGEWDQKTRVHPSAGEGE